ncbi:hypothetical protein IZU99_05185 [Oscillospiraceae bacterium CM]|nr:hypothetical protein IZU99_05185 [Oscillospiraceae bacterium CM]
MKRVSLILTVIAIIVLTAACSIIADVSQNESPKVPNTQDGNTVQNSLAGQEMSNYIGVYSIDNPGGGVYDKDLIFIEAFDWSHYYWQYPDAFALLENGKVSRNEGADPFYSGTWRVEDNMIIIEELSISRYLISGDMLFKIVEKSDIKELVSSYGLKTNEPDKIAYEGFGKSPITSYDYPPK